jgi:hypothetical protein
VNLENALIAPLFLHVLLILFIGLRSVFARIATVKSGETKLSHIALNSAAWPDHVRKLGNNFNNQFEVPWLWYAVCGFLLMTHKVDILSIYLSWGFFVSRVVHSFIHMGSNVVRNRMFAFLIGFALVFLMWAWFGFRLYVIG